MKIIQVIRDAMNRRNEAPPAAPRDTPAWWQGLLEELQRGGAALVASKQLAQFGARFNGVAVIVDARSSSSREIASFELRLTTGTQTLSCAALNEPAMRMM